MFDWSTRKLNVDSEPVEVEKSYDVIESVKQGFSDLETMKLYDSFEPFKELYLAVAEGVMFIEGHSRVNDMSFSSDTSLYSYMEQIKGNLDKEGVDKSFNLLIEGVLVQFGDMVEKTALRLGAITVITDYESKKRSGNKNLDRRIMTFARELKNKNTKKVEADLLPLVYKGEYGGAKFPFNREVYENDLMVKPKNHPFFDNVLLDALVSVQHFLYSLPVKDMVSKGCSLTVEVTDEGKYVFS